MAASDPSRPEILRTGIPADLNRPANDPQGGLMPHLNEVQVLRFLIQFTLLFVIARALADAAKRLGQATVIGELLAGIVLGPTLLGHFAPGLHAMLFPPDVLADHLLEAVAWIGVIMLLLYTGLETDLGILRGVGNAAFAVSALGVIVPAATGF